MNQRIALAGPRIWIIGARPRTLGAAVIPVVVGTALAASQQSVLWPRAFGAGLVALGMQVGVNYANDYSDGVRGTDTDRRGPARLVGSGLASATAVRRAAIFSFIIAMVAGTALALVTNPWLMAVGALSLVAGWLYTGGPRPYGYAGLGEVAVFIFFGLVATCGSAYVQAEKVTAQGVVAGTALGLVACAILMTNNIRDIAGDRDCGKRTLAVRIGDRSARRLYVGTLVCAFVAAATLGITHWQVLIAQLAIPLAIGPAHLVMTRTDPPGLVAALVGTARLQVVFGALLAAGLWLA